MKKLYILWLLIALALILSACYLTSGNLGVYLDLPSLILSLIIPLLISLSFNNPAEIASFIREAGESNKGDLRLAHQGLIYFQTLQTLMIFMGIISTLIGSISILNNFNLANKVSIGKGVGVLLLTLLYSLIFVVLITQPFIGSFKKKLSKQ